MANKTIYELDGQEQGFSPTSSSLFAMYENGRTGKASVQQILNTTIPGLTTENGTTVKTAVNNLASTVDNLASTDFIIADNDSEEASDVEFTSNDELNPSSTTPVELLTGNENWSDRFLKISKMFKNIRYLIKMLGTTDISSASTEGTVTGAINNLNTKIDKVGTFYNPKTKDDPTENPNYITNIPDGYGSETILASFNILEKGIYLVWVSSLMAGSSVGVRGISINNGSWNNTYATMLPANNAASNSNTVVNGIRIFNVPNDGGLSTPIKVIAKQNSGVTLSSTTRINIVRFC